MAENKKPANLDVLSGVAGQITVRGAVHDVLDLDGEDYRKINAMEELGIVEMYVLCEKLVPSLGEGVNRLNAKQLGAIIAIADGRIQSVEAQFPNAFGPETETPPAPSPAST